MRKFNHYVLAICCLLTGALFATCATARDTALTFPLEDVLENSAHEGHFDGVQFYFGDQAHPEIDRKMGEYQANRKTNAVNKTDREACEWALVSSLKSLRDRAVSMGGDAVVNIYGYYKKRTFRSEDEFQCGAGAIMAGVTLKGTVVKLAE